MGVAAACNLTVDQHLDSGFSITVLGDDILFHLPGEIEVLFDQGLFLDTMREMELNLKSETDPTKSEIFLNMTPGPDSSARSKGRFGDSSHCGWPSEES